LDTRTSVTLMVCAQWLASESKHNKVRDRNGQGDIELSSESPACGSGRRGQLERSGRPRDIRRFIEEGVRYIGLVCVSTSTERSSGQEHGII
jgi:hypothetical protein